jgi:hypothetical protein
MEATDFLASQALRERDGGKPGGMQNLIGISVADSAEQMRIGERPLERMVLGSQSLRERIEARIKGFEPAWV